MNKEDVVKGRKYKCIDGEHRYCNTGDIIEVRNISGNRIYYLPNTNCCVGDFLECFEPVEFNESKFNVGDKVEIIGDTGGTYHSHSIGDIGIILTGLQANYGGSYEVEVTIGNEDAHCQNIKPCDMVLVSKNKTSEEGETNMTSVTVNENISKLYAKTEDALLVNKHFRDDLMFRDGLGLLFVADKAKEILAKAQQLEVEENKKED